MVMQWTTCGQALETTVACQCLLQTCVQCVAVIQPSHEISMLTSAVPSALSPAVPCFTFVSCRATLHLCLQQSHAAPSSLAEPPCSFAGCRPEALGHHQRLCTAANPMRSAAGSRADRGCQPTHASAAGGTAEGLEVGGNEQQDPAEPEGWLRLQECQHCGRSMR